MTHSIRPYTALLGILICLMQARAFGSPGVGDEALTLGPIQWLGDKPPVVPTDANSDEYIIAVEMFASWNTESMNSLAILTELAVAFADQKVIFLVITNEDAASVSEIAENLTQQKGLYFGGDVDIVATENWADDIDILPMMYVLTKAGKVAWRGNPVKERSAVEQVLRDLSEGNFSMDKATDAELRDAKYAQLEADLRGAYEDNDKDAIFRVLDRMIATKPSYLHPYLIKRQAIINFEEYVRLPAHTSLTERRFKDSAEDLASLIDVERNLDPSERNLKYLLRTVERLLFITEREEPEALKTAASVYADLGLFENAIQLLETAADTTSDPYEVMMCEKTIAYYQNVINLRRQLINSTNSDSTSSAATRPG